jgi:hypothetical protein
MSNMTAEIPREKLKELIEKNGETLLQDPDRCEGLLKDHCGSHRREISALVGALEERIPLELKSSWQSAMTPEAMRARLVQRLEDNRGLAPEVANWAVDAWSYALGVGLARQSDRVEIAVGDAPAGGAAAVGLGAGLGAGAAGSTWAAGNPRASVAERIASDRAGGAAATPKASTIAQMSTPRKAGFGAVALLALGIGAYAVINHHPTPQPVPDPTPAPAPAPAPKPKPDIKAGPAGSGDGTDVKGDDHGVMKNNPQLPPKFLPAGTIISVRLDQSVNSDRLNMGDFVEATVSSPITVDGNIVVSTGAKARLKVTGVEHTAKDGGAEHLQLALAEVTTEQGRVQVSAPARQFDGPTLHAEQAKRGGIGAAAGAVGGFVVGKIFHHGGAGAAAGAGGGAVAGVVTAKPSPVKVAAETPMHFRLSASVKAPAQTTAKR